MTHNICADYEPTGDAMPGVAMKKIFQTIEHSRAFMNEPFCNSRRNVRS